MQNFSRNLNGYLVILFAILIASLFLWIGLNYVIMPIYGDFRFQFLEILVAVTLIRVVYKVMTFDDITETKFLLEQNNRLLVDLLDVSLKSAINSRIYYTYKMPIIENNQTTSRASDNDDKSGNT